MIVGIGVELVDLPRFERADLRYGERLRERLFTAGERAYVAGKRRGVESLAARFAAKVAARRALGLDRLAWHEVEIVRERGRAPQLALHGVAAARAADLGVARAVVSLTHDRTTCVGHVLLEDAT